MYVFDTFPLLSDTEKNYFFFKSRQNRGYCMLGFFEYLVGLLAGIEILFCGNFDSIFFYQHSTS